MRGMIKPAALVAWCERHGVRAAAVTDYGNMSAAVELYKACKGTNVMPIYGMEVNVVPDKTMKVKGAYRMILLARNRDGFKNLCTIATVGSMFYYYIPRIDIAVLEEYGEGLIGITGDIGGVAAEAFFAKQNDGLLELNGRLAPLFGDHLYFEIEPVPTESQRVLNDAIVSLAADGKLKIVATGDPHYMSESDRELHENMMAIKQVRNPGWVYPMKGPYHVRTHEEMVAGFADLHGYDVSYSPGFKDALEAPNAIIDTIESFDLRENVKIPSYTE